MAVASVVAINLEKRLVALRGGAVVSIASMIDIDGNRTDDPAKCFAATVQLPSGMWACCYLDGFEDSTTQ